MLVNNKILTAAVLPDPVCAIPTTSLPERAIGQPTAWIGVGWDQDCARILLITYSKNQIMMHLVKE